MEHFSLKVFRLLQVTCPSDTIQSAIMRISVRYRYIYGSPTSNRTAEWARERGGVSYRTSFAERLSHGPWHTCSPLPRSPLSRFPQSPISLGQKPATRYDMTVGLRPFHGANIFVGAVLLTLVSTWIYNHKHNRIANPKCRTYRPTWCSSSWPSYPAPLPSAACDSAFGCASRPGILGVVGEDIVGFPQPETNSMWLIFGGYHGLYI